MSAADLLAELRRKQVGLEIDGDKLRYRAPKGAITPELLESIRHCKSELLQLLRRNLENREDRVGPQVARRVEAFRGLLGDWATARRTGFPLLVLSGIHTSESGCCISCGEPVEHDCLRCDPCHEAACIVMEEVRKGRETQPHIGPSGELVVSLVADSRFRWWEAQTPEDLEGRFKVARIAAGLSPLDDGGDS